MAERQIPTEREILDEVARWVAEGKVPPPLPPDATEADKRERNLRHTAKRVLTDHANEGDAANGVRLIALALAFRTGVQVQGDKEVFTPLANATCMHPGAANYESCQQALADGTLTFTATSFADLIVEAASDKAAFDACGIITEYCAKHGHDIAPDLARWQALNPARPRGGAMHKCEVRDMAIIMAVWVLSRDHGVTAMRNDASAHNSACDYVAIAMRELKMPGAGYDAVKAIWKHAWRMKDGYVVGIRRPRNFPTT